jgi:hypothetical protein
MVTTKNPMPSIELRLSLNLSLDNVGFERLYQELRDIETGATDLVPIQIHALKRRHLLKILHLYCADGIKPAEKNFEAKSYKASQSTFSPAVETMRQEHPPPTTSSAVDADQALLDSGFGFQKKA